MASAGQIEALSSYASTSTVESSNYDVFLNFRGKDIRKNFAGHLYSALKSKGINVFMDSHKLREGEEIGPALVKAIQGSQISIPIFSKRYADSKWCLMELAQIRKCHKSNHQSVMPIFMDVEPSEVRNQTGSFEEAFIKHERKFQPQIVNRWRRALRKFCLIKLRPSRPSFLEIGSTYSHGFSSWYWVLISRIGLVVASDTDWDESKLIELVVEESFTRTSNIYLSDVKYPVELHSRVNDLQSLLNIGLKDVWLIGICGEGGIGKTTIAKGVYNCIVKSFHQACFLANIREEALRGPSGVVSLQEKLISGMFKVEARITNVDQGKEEIRKRCRGKNILLVLDDVDHRSQLEALAIDGNWLGQGSRVIITTRDEHILNVTGIDCNDIYRPKELDIDQSLRLFSLHAFKRDEPIEEYKELSHDVACYSGGLPLTLEVLGSYLSDISNKKEWESALQKLRASPHKEVYEKLKISYDNLDDGYQKEIFLDAACFFVGWNKRDVIPIWEACEYHPKLAIKKLVQRSLLKFVVGYNSEEYLEMHDQIRDMGRQIVLEESCDMPGKRNRLWTRKEIMEVLEGHQGTENIKGIFLRNEWAKPQFPVINLSIECLEKMSSLKFFDVESALCEGDDFPHLPYGLRWFRWRKCPIQVLRKDFYHKSLVHLDLSEGKFQVAWNSRPQNEYKKFQNLKVLKLSSCGDLYKCPDFSWFPSLERLDLSSCYSLGDLDESIGQLRHLESLDLSFCQSLSKLPQSIGQLNHLKSLNLRNCKSLSKLPESIGQLSHLERLNLCHCSSLSKLPQSMGDLKSLVKLWLVDTIIDELPDGVGLLEKLEALHVEYYSKLVKLPRSMERMRSLRMIKLDGTNISKLPNDFPICFSVFSQLQILHLGRGCKNVESFPADLSDLKNLVELCLCGLEKLGYLPVLPSSLIKLSCVDCKSLARLPDLSRLEILRRLTLNYCPKLEKIEGVEVMESLEEFSVKSCYNLYQKTKGCCKVRYTPRKHILENFEVRRSDDGIDRYEPLFSICGLGATSKYFFSNANDGIRKQLCLIIVFEFCPHIFGDMVQECELVHIELEFHTRIYGNDGKETYCYHTILIEKVECTTKQDIVYIHGLEGFTWFGFPLERKHGMEGLLFSEDCIYKLPDSGVQHPLRDNVFCGLNLKFWSLEYVNGESWQLALREESKDDRLKKRKRK